jgi:hypothetical protein
MLKARNAIEKASYKMTKMNDWPVFSYFLMGGTSGRESEQWATVAVRRIILQREFRES